jgi:hypothetical protein
VTYLSMRMREIRAEEARRKEPKLYLGIDYAWPEHGELFPPPLYQSIMLGGRKFSSKFLMVNYLGRGA